MYIEQIHHSYKTIRFFPLLLSFFLLTSCKGQATDIHIETDAPDPAKSTGTMVISSSEPAPTQHDKVSKTDAVEPTQWISQPSSTPSPVVIQYPQVDIDAPLSSEGPWLIYTSEYGAGEWYIINADGSGRKKLADADDRHIPMMYPSSRSDYLAYVVRNEDLFQNEIILFHLPDLEIVERIDLISYPGLRDSTEYDGGSDGEKIIGSRYALREGPIWSHDGRYLAFTGAIEGPSSDVYIYDTQSNQVKRLTCGSNQAVRLKWSPDSQWIVHREVNGFGAGCYDVATWASAVDGSRNQRLYEPECDAILGWLSPSTFISFDARTGKAQDLRIVDLVKNQTTPLFQGDFIPYGLNPVTFDIIFEPIEGESDTSQYSSGLYMLSPTNPEPKWIYSEHIPLQWDAILQRLVSEDFLCEAGEIGSLTSEGDFECVKRTLTEADLIWSPDRQWSIDRATGRTLYNASAEPIHEITSDGPNDVIWRPDSSGVFLKSEYALLHMQIPDGDVFLVDNRNPEYTYWVSID